MMDLELELSTSNFSRTNVWIGIQERNWNYGLCSQFHAKGSIDCKGSMEHSTMYFMYSAISALHCTCY